MSANNISLYGDIPSTPTHEVPMTPILRKIIETSPFQIVPFTPRDSCRRHTQDLTPSQSQNQDVQVAPLLVSDDSFVDVRANMIELCRTPSSNSETHDDQIVPDTSSVRKNSKMFDLYFIKPQHCSSQKSQGESSIANSKNSESGHKSTDTEGKCYDIESPNSSKVNLISKYFACAETDEATTSSQHSVRNEIISSQHSIRNEIIATVKSKTKESTRIKRILLASLDGCGDNTNKLISGSSTKKVENSSLFEHIILADSDEWKRRHCRCGVESIYGLVPVVALYSSALCPVPASRRHPIYLPRPSK